MDDFIKIKVQLLIETHPLMSKTLYQWKYKLDLQYMALPMQVM